MEMKAHLQILLAEDEREIRELVTLGLKLNGMTVTSVGDGQLAVAAAGEQAYDLIMLDMNMPRMGGLQAAEAIRALAVHRDTPILFLSGDDEAHDLTVSNAYSLGKPFTIRELAGCVRELLTAPQLPSSAETA